MDIPVYVIAGFLDSGKTNFLNGVLSDGFADDSRTLLLCCEEGEEEYEPRFLKNVTVINVEDEEQLTTEYFTNLEKQYKPTQVLVEYNGMWPLATLDETLPENWILYQIMTFVEASTFEVYSRNMGQIMMEKIMNADLLVFNRCTPELRDSLRKRNLRMVNRRADIYLENMDGSSENYLTGNETPFDMTQEVIDVPDDDFGVFYVDVMDHPERYDHKKVHLKLTVCHSEQYPGVCVPGRFAMVCCAEDITFLGLVGKGPMLKNYKNHDWIDATVEIRLEHNKAYEIMEEKQGVEDGDGEGPVMYMLDVTPCEAPKDDIVQF